MQLRPETENGLHTLRFLALRDQNETGPTRAPVAEVAAELNLSEAQLLSISQPLVEHGYLQITLGPPASMRLAFDPSEIRLGDVIRVYEGPLRLLPSLEQHDSVHEGTACKLSEILDWAARELRGFLNQYTLEQILPAVPNPTELRAPSAEETPNPGAHLHIVPS